MWKSLKHADWTYNQNLTLVYNQNSFSNAVKGAILEPMRWRGGWGQAYRPLDTFHTMRKVRKIGIIDCTNGSNNKVQRNWVEYSSNWVSR